MTLITNIQHWSKREELKHTDCTLDETKSCVQVSVFFKIQDVPRDVVTILQNKSKTPNINKMLQCVIKLQELSRIGCQTVHIRHISPANRSLDTVAVMA